MVYREEQRQKMLESRESERNRGGEREIERENRQAVVINLMTKHYSEI